MSGVRAFAETIYDELYPICNDRYSKDIHTADEMIRKDKGNCFTLAEMACRRLIDSPGIVSAGIVLEAAPRNTHAYAIGVSEAISAVMILDLVDSKVRFPHITRTTRNAIKRQLTEADSVLYRSRQPGSNTPRLDVVALTDHYEWPQQSRAHRVYIPGEAGITALQALARSGGMRANLQRNELDRTVQSQIPEIPQR